MFYIFCKLNSYQLVFVDEDVDVNVDVEAMVVDVDDECDDLIDERQNDGSNSYNDNSDP